MSDTTPDPVSPDDLERELVYALACSRNTAQWFAARGSGLYHSLDGGVSWDYLFASLNLESPLPATSVVLSPDYDGAEHGELYAGVPGGVLRSTDAGATWFASILDAPPPAVSAMVISPSYVEDGVVLAATTEDGIFRSASRGSQWVRWNFGLLDLTVFCLEISPGFAEDETLFAGVESGIFRSTNGGRAWREVDLSVGFEPVISLALSPSYPEDGIIFAGTETQGLYVSTDDGMSWTRLGADAIVGPINSIVVSPGLTDRPDILVLSDEALLLSRDGGAIWSKVERAPEGMSAVLAPKGLVPRSPLLIGLVNGDVVCLALDS